MCVVHWSACGAAMTRNKSTAKEISHTDCDRALHALADLCCAINGSGEMIDT